VLKEWLRAIVKIFPPMNGPLASEDPDDSKVTDYSIGRALIHAAFAWSEAKSAYQLVKEL
jgi:hypothetical protein